MKVMCINEGWQAFPDEQKAYKEPVYGEVYNVFNAFTNHGVEFYELRELPGDAFEQSAFVPLSDIDERKILIEKEKECI